MSRYRSQLEKSQARLLGILDQVRDQTSRAEAAVREADGKAIELRLRVVK